MYLSLDHGWMPAGPKLFRSSTDWLMKKPPTDDELIERASEIGRALVDAGMTLATAESCTGGWVGRVLTAVPGSSNWYERGFVTYSNAAKSEMLGVSVGILTRDGAVSEATARAMAQGTLAHSRAQVAVAITWARL